MSTIISNVQAAAGWSVVTGSSIGPVPPSKCSLSQQQRGLVNSLLIAVTGVPGKYADAMCRSIDTPLPANTGNLKMFSTFALDANSLVETQAAEIGTKLTLPNGLTLNGQTQWDYSKSATGMVLDVTAKNYDWASTGIVIPKFTPNELHTQINTYEFTEDAISLVAVEVDGVVYEIPTNPYGVPGQKLGWGANAMIAGFQPDTNPKGLSWNWEVFDVKWIVS
jgi:hypothetical protein